MPNRWIPYVKVLVHLACLLPFAKLIWTFQSGELGLMADPVNWITHFTGYWTLFLLLVSLAVTPVRRLHANFSNLIRFRRMLGLYAFFYATLHLLTYAFLFSGYDLPGTYAAVRLGHPGAALDGWKAVWPTVRDDLQKRRFVQVGFVSWLILLALAASSPAWVMRRMGGRRWQTLHRMVYFAATLGVIHYWWLVKTGVRAPLPMTIVLVVLLAARAVWSVVHRKPVPAAAHTAAV